MKGKSSLDEEAESLTRRAEAYGVVSLTINEVVADEIKASCQQLGPNVPSLAMRQVAIASKGMWQAEDLRRRSLASARERVAHRRF